MEGPIHEIDRWLIGSALGKIAQEDPTALASRRDD
jgi:hypothetical protein